MIQFTARLGGRVFGVSCRHPATHAFCETYLCNLIPEVALVLTEKDTDFERFKAAKEDEIEGNPPREYSDAYLETLALLRKVTENLLDFDTVLFHGSVIAVDGVAYLFTAKSGTGKSTHTRLWREMLGNRAKMVNDDKPFLQITAENVVAWGNPWMGKHRLGANIQVPLKAICILERGETNEIHRIEPKDAVHMILQQSSRPQDAKKLPKYLDLMDSLSQRVEFYRLRCNMSPEAARIAFDAMGDCRDPFGASQ